MENRWTIIEFFLDALKQYVKRNTIVVSEIPQSDQDSDLKPIVTSSSQMLILTLHGGTGGQPHNLQVLRSFKKTIIGFINKKYYQRVLMKRK